MKHCKKLYKYRKRQCCIGSENVLYINVTVILSNVNVIISAD